MQNPFQRSFYGREHRRLPTGRAGRVHFRSLGRKPTRKNLRLGRELEYVVLVLGFLHVLTILFFILDNTGVLEIPGMVGIMRAVAFSTMGLGFILHVIADHLRAGDSGISGRVLWVVVPTGIAVILPLMMPLA